MKRGNLLFNLLRQTPSQVQYLLKNRYYLNTKLFLWVLIPAAALVTLTALASSNNPPSPFNWSDATSAVDTIPLNERYDDYINNPGRNPFDLEDPDIINQEVEYDPETNQYIITERIGDDYFRAPTYMTFEEYLDYKAKKQQEEYFQKISSTSSTRPRRGDALANALNIDPNNPLGKIDIEKSLADRLFGGSGVDIRPQGSIDLTFGLERSVIENPVLTERQRRQPPQFLFDMVPQIDVAGSIGEKLNLNLNYNSQATFDFDRQIMKLEYASDAFSEDDIIKTIEAGNVSLPLPGSLIQGAQSLFGLKTQLQFGRLYVTGIASQQKSEREEIQIKGGSQVQEYEVFADEYDENRHFLLSHFNRENFNESLENLPQILSLFTIEQIDVWITNDRNVTAREGEPGPRDIVALSDLGEGNILTNPARVRVNPGSPKDIDQEFFLPSNNVNDLYDKLINTPGIRKIDRAVSTLQNQYGLQQARDFEKVSARRLREGSEFTVNRELGFVSLNVNVQQDQVLGVAFQYSYNGRTYKVGELYNDAPATGVTADTNTVSQDVLFVKMLKSTTPRVDIPLWDLMMKNFYNIGAYQVDRKDFKLDVFYEDTGVTSGARAADPGRGRKRFLPATNLEGIPLIRVFRLDELNVQGDPGRDGVFDFVPGLTIYPRTGRIMFPILEPFGEYLEEQITTGDEALFVYNELYDSTVIIAREYPELNRFTIRGEYRSSISSEISLGAFNIPEGSVTVRAGGTLLKEGIDYEIDYNIGRVRILNDAYLSSGIPINVSFEDNNLFGFQTKTLVGLRADYKFNENFNLGGTFLQLLERPFTQKVNIGDDPINNKIYGLDLNYSADAPWLTRMVDKIPLIDTKAPSSVSIVAEAAALKPGHSRAINEQAGEDKGGVLYLDDFEGSASGIDLRQPANAWVLASVPQNTSDGQGGSLFPEAALIDDIRAGANRAKISWYRIDPQLRAPQFDPAGTANTNPYTSRVPVNELFPNRTNLPTENSTIFTFDLNYNPARRGPYNYDVPGGYPGISAGITTDRDTVALADPESRWGGIMRSLNINNFEQANVQFIEFWMLSPFLGDNSTGGDLYIDLGNISEDILRDSRKFFENGLPGPANPDRKTAQTDWSRVPLTQQVTNAFDTDVATREAQDVGLDGLGNDGERAKFRDYLTAIQGLGNATAINDIQRDPSNDDYYYYTDNFFPPSTPILERYSKYNNQEGNSQPPVNGITFSATNRPDAEDLNQDQTLNETESYFQYKIPLRPGGGGTIAASKFITDERRVDGNGRIWYRYRIPVDDNTRKSIGGIQDLRSVRFMRVYLKDFEQPVTLRFARFELVRNQWRTYYQSLAQDSLVNPDFPTAFDLNAVNIEENSNRCPFPYVLPPGIQREQNIGVFQGLQNEQSLSLQVSKLADGDARAIYKTLNLDLRNYERMKMFVHAEKVGDPNCPEDAQEDIDCDPNLEDGDVTAFIRLGSDFKNNYYEYEIPLSISDPDSIANLNIVNGTVFPREYIDQVWKAVNEFDISLEWLKDAKIARNQGNGRLADEFVGYTPPEGLPPGHAIKIKGNPTLGYVKAIMIGIRNPKDDGEAHCVEIWANELRMQGLNEQGGYAATARLDLQMADFGSFSAAANYSSIGFGALDQQLNERSLEEISGFDVAANIELSRFLPADWGLRLPAYAAYSKEVTRPKFDPYDLDIPLKENLALAEDKAERDTIRQRSQDVTTIKTVSLNNVGKNRTSSGAPMPWDISNFTASYAYSETENSDPLIEYDRIDSHQGSIDYTYALPTKPIEPFKNLPDKDWLKVLRDLNFNPLPNSFAFSTTLYREVAETKYRFTDLDPVFSTFYNKQFTWDRTFDMNWDFARALKINFSSTSFSVIDEPDESELRLARPDLNDDQIRRVIRDSIFTNIREFGRPKNYQHTLNVNFTLPTRSIPLLDWIDVRAQYSADYGWAAAALNVEDLGLGNIIQNGQRRQVTGDLNFEKLYDKWGYLKQINRPARRSGRSSGRRTPARRPTSKTEGEDKKKKEREVSKVERALIRPFLLVRKGRVNYSEQFGTVVPGFLPSSSVLGLSPGFNAPGWDFVAGLQPKIRTLDQSEFYTSEDWLHQISNVGSDTWLTPSILLNQKVAQQYSQTMDAQLTLEPIPDLRIDIEARRNFAENHTQTFKDTLNDGINDWVHAVPVNVGSLTLSYFALNTFFQNNTEQNANSDLKELFQTFEQNRLTISQLLGVGTHQDSVLAGEGYAQGFGRVQQDVLIPAFIAAYTGKRVQDVGVQENYVRGKLFKNLPIPNWRITYNGLSKLPLFEDIFQSVNITHAYSSQMQINSFNTDLDFIQDPTGVNPNTKDFYSRLEIPEIVIQESFSPLLGIDIRTQNDISLRANFSRSRTLAMSFVSNQLAETQSEQYQVGFGWLMSDINIGFLRNMVNNNPKRKKKKTTDDNGGPLSFPGNNRGGGGGGAQVGDLDINMDFSLRDDVTFNHLLDQDIVDPTRGTKQISFSPSAEYQVHERLALRLFFDYSRTVPKVSTSFPITNSAGGVVVRFTLNE